jgi:GMP synthase (glutamine-hydrolysing)
MKDACWNRRDSEPAATRWSRPWGLIRRDASQQPGLIETVTRLRNIELQSYGEMTPELEQLAALVLLDAPACPVFRATELIRRAIRLDTPVLAIGSGARVLAETLGARARPSEGRGTAPTIAPMFLTDDGCCDRVLGAAPSPVDVIHLERDYFELPAGATALASSPSTPTQAFRYRRAYALPFHLEIDTDLARRWAIAPPPDATVRAGISVFEMFTRLVIERDARLGPIVSSV